MNVRQTVENIHTPLPTLITLIIPPRENPARILQMLQEDLQVLQTPGNLNDPLVMKVILDTIDVVEEYVGNPLPTNGIMCFVGRTDKLAIKVINEPDTPINTSLYLRNTRFHYIE
jgi:peptide subunit release factor 1 (eRF1)